MSQRMSGIEQHPIGIEPDLDFLSSAPAPISGDARSRRLLTILRARAGGGIRQEDIPRQPRLEQQRVHIGEDLHHDISLPAARAIQLVEGSQTRRGGLLGGGERSSVGEMQRSEMVDGG